MKRTMSEPVRIGLDFDGVVAYNPFRIIRAPIKFVKRKFLGVKSLTFFVPKNGFERWMWTIVHESSVLPGIGLGKVHNLTAMPQVELYLVTARYGFLRKNLFAWLERHKLTDCFKEIVVNERTIQPHLYKEEEARRLKLDYFVEDNYDIVTHMSTRVPTKVLWIYNLLDKQRPFPHKFSNIGNAIDYIIEDLKLRNS